MKPMPLRLLSRSSDLATLQARLVASALRARWPALEVVLTTQSSAGDRDRRVALWAAADKGLFTTDLSQALVDGRAEAVVHSWKDLPIAPFPGTQIAATLERADPRDLLLVRRDVVEARPAALSVLTSSPRRAWQIGQSLIPLLPWPVAAIATNTVRGNIPTRLARLAAGEGHALIVAKAAIDRLVSDAAPPATSRAVRAAIDACRWMALPLREFPTAPAQGALAVEVAAGGGEAARLVAAIDHAPTRRAVEVERAILAEAGGGCHEAIGATLRIRAYGDVLSVRGLSPGGVEQVVWSLRTDAPAPPRTTEARIWPRRDERDRANRGPIEDAVVPPGADGLWVSRAEALPASFSSSSAASDAVCVWASGTRTWKKLAARGVWVHGCADGLGDAEAPGVDALAGHPIIWLRLTHADAAGDPGTLATYAVAPELPDDLASRTHFYWTSGQLFLEAIARVPAIRAGFHGSGPGRTARVIHETLGATAHARVWLDYDQWLQTVIP
jgi:hydroxymethylbilane synthase